MQSNNIDDTNQLVNLSSFSIFLGKEFNIPSTVFFEHILCMLSLSIAHLSSDTTTAELNKLYEDDNFTYYEAVHSSECISNVLLSLGTLEMQDFTLKILGMLLISEQDIVLRRQLVRIISILHPNIYRTVKKHNFKYFKLQYQDFHDFIYSDEAKYDRAVFLYLSFYCSPDWVDQNLLYAITQSIYQSESYHPLQADIVQEIQGDITDIEKLQKELFEGKSEMVTYRDILSHSKKELAAIANVFENLFYLNKLDPKELFSTFITKDSSSTDLANDYHQNLIYLAIIKQDKYSFSQSQKQYLYIACLFLNPLLNEYKKAKTYYFEHNQEQHEIQLLQEKNEKLRLQKELEQTKKELASLKNELQNSASNTENSINSVKKGYEAQLSTLNRTVSTLSDELEEEKSHRQELNKLREYIFSLDIPITPNENEQLTLKDYISNKRIIIVGGPRQWRRRLRESFPFLDTLSGTSTSFDLSLFTQIDCVLFYTNYMSHSIYHRAMNYIRTNNLKFGYLKSTNIQLIEYEIIEVLKQCDVIKEKV